MELKLLQPFNELSLTVVLINGPVHRDGAGIELECLKVEEFH